MTDNLGQLYQEREKRVMAAIQLKIPDRVPIASSFGYFVAKYNGISCKAAYYDYEKWLAAFKKTVLDFDIDMVFIMPFSPGNIMEMLDPRQIKWPGHGVSPDHSHQTVELENMKSDEYDLFLYDMSDFLIRRHLPRLYGSLDKLKNLPPLSSVLFDVPGVMNLAESLSSPQVLGALETLLEVGRELAAVRPKTGGFGEEISNLGYPLYSVSSTLAPFDIISDFLRGMRGSMMDMYRQPDKIIAACEKLLPLALKSAVMIAKASGNPRVFIPLHRGAHGFMSLEQFEKFYWPTLKKLIIGLTEEGLIPCVFFEGNYTSRLEYLLELPKGKVLARFDTTDIFKAKEVLNGHLCIQGNVPPSLLQTGTVQDVKDYCKKLIDVVGKDGGLIITPRSVIDEVKPENLHAMIDITKEYGVYR